MKSYIRESRHGRELLCSDGTADRGHAELGGVVPVANILFQSHEWAERAAEDGFLPEAHLPNKCGARLRCVSEGSECVSW